MHILLKKLQHKNKNCCLVVSIGGLVNLDCLPWWLINPNNCASISSVISSSRLVTVLAQRGTHATFWTAVSHKSSQQMSIAAGRINSSPTVKNVLVLAMQLATKNDALRADTFDEVVAFNNCFSSSCSHFFLLKNSKGLCFNAGYLVFMWWSSFKVSWLHWTASHHILNKVGLENVNHLCNESII